MKLKTIILLVLMCALLIFAVGCQEDQLFSDVGQTEARENHVEPSGQLHSYRDNSYLEAYAW